ncbi:hypothetical protein [Halococcus agarilyticus]|uniref:hypothetical protein n=1 Tax=Halococcus agarilyticus TaxID=1232219 RepID=UPI0006779501|nr:hypothetical protein [Halococcus agarilyticus]
MAQSRDGSIIDDHELDAAFDRADLPEGEARLVYHEEGVTTIVQGDADEVERRFNERIADELGMAVEELDDVDEYPMPDPLDDEPV